MTFTTEMVKGYPSYSVVDEDGTIVARSHCVQVQMRLFTIVINEKWRGNLPEDKAVALLKGMC